MGQLSVVDQQLRDRFGRDTRAALFQLLSERFDDLLLVEAKLIALPVLRIL